MHICKRDGRLEPVSFDKVLRRLQNLCVAKLGQTALPHINCEEISKKVIAGIYDGVSTSALDEIAANVSFPLAFEDPEYDILAKRIIVSNYHKNNIYLLYNHFIYTFTNIIREWELKGSTDVFSEEYVLALVELDYLREKGVDAIQNQLYYWVCRALFENNDSTGQQAPLITPNLFSIVSICRDELETLFDYNYDYRYAYMGFRLLESNYLLKANLYTLTGERIWVPIERPQHMLMRVALGLWCSNKYTDIDSARTDHKMIWQSIRDDCIPLLSSSTFEKLNIQIDVMSSNVNWMEIAALLRSHHAPISLLRKVDSLCILHTKSWPAVLALYLNSNKDIKLQELEMAIESYLLSREMKFTHATPTLFNSGTLRPQNSSCFLLPIPEDSIEGITDHWRRVALISKWAGGVGSSIHNIRPLNSYIRGTNGHSNGHVPMLKVVDEISRYVDQGGGKRPGSHALYIEPWCGDIEAIIKLKRPRSDGKEAAITLFFGMWIPDEFMRCVEANKPWYLMDPNISIGLSEAYDESFSTKWLTDAEVSAAPDKFAFTALYRRYIRESKYIQSISAATLWSQICITIEEAGTPYICFKDAGNRKSNQKNLGTIKSSNLCTEIFEFSASDEVAVCNLASICLPQFIAEAAIPLATDAPQATAAELPTYFDVSLDKEKHVYKMFKWGELQDVIRLLVRNLDKLIDINYYPLREAQLSNQRHRPMGIGIQGWADLCSALRLPITGNEANKLSFYIFECMYHTALSESVDLAHRKSAYDTFKGSPLSQGQFSHDLWQTEQLGQALKFPLLFDWEELRAQIIKTGVRNSLFIAPMPTASTSGIMGFSPCFEPHNALIYKRKNKAGEFGLANMAFIKDMQSLGLWTPEIRAKLLMSHEGSIHDIWEIPEIIRNIYPTAWDLDPKSLIDSTLVRDPFVDQSSSFNWFIRKPTTALLNKLHFYGWRRGKKTSSYYTRRLAVADAQKIQVEQPVAEDVCIINADGTRSCCDS
jgi:ribonucleoside-diphosphate reductase alpha chain